MTQSEEFLMILHGEDSRAPQTRLTIGCSNRISSSVENELSYHGAVQEDNHDSVFCQPHS